ncbi:MAG: pantoate--beta-alanine ligase, partial [Bacteroidales bacterium]
MRVVTTVADLRTAINNAKEEGKKIGFVPTMGALHNGHIQLVKRCVAENEFAIVSVFVNPTQFNDQNDLLKYPRTLEADCKLLEEAGCSLVFAPTVEEVYPEEDTRQFDFGQLDKVMEGEFRPGHFNGVAQVVSKLFDMVTPDNAYFGEKDFQQLAIIRQMVKQLKSPVEIHPCPIVREESGLAMSSRNTRLTPEQLAEAPKIYQTLLASKAMKETKSVAEVKAWVINELNKNEFFRVEYFDIVDGLTLQSLNSWSESGYAVGCIAVFCGEVR